MTVPPGCRILIFSDGAHELALNEGRSLTLTEFKDLAVRVYASPDCSLDHLVAELTALTPTGEFEDDCSLIQLLVD